MRETNIPADSRSPVETESSTERYERLAAEFERDTGMMAPGKDVPAPFNEVHNRVARQAAWSDWLSKRRSVSTPEPSEPTANSQRTINSSHSDSSPPSAEELSDDRVRRRSIDEAVAIASDMDVDPLTIDECSALDTLEFYARLYQRQQSALDALAVAVKGCGAHTLCGKDGPSGYLCGDCEEKRDIAITALLDGRAPNA